MDIDGKKVKFAKGIIRTDRKLRNYQCHHPKIFPYFAQYKKKINFVTGCKRRPYTLRETS